MFCVEGKATLEGVGQNMTLPGWTLATVQAVAEEVDIDAKCVALHQRSYFETSSRKSLSSVCLARPLHTCKDHEPPRTPKDHTCVVIVIIDQYLDIKNKERQLLVF